MMTVGREEDAEGGADSGLAFDPHAAALSFGEGLSDAEADAGVTNALDEGAVGAVGASKDALEVFVADAAAGVGDTEDHEVVFGLDARGEDDFGVGHRGGAGVSEEARDDLENGIAIGGDRREVVGDVHAEANTLFAELRADAGEGVFNNLYDFEVLLLKHEGAGINSSDAEEIINSIRHALGAGFDSFEETALESADDADGFAHEEIGIADDGRERLAQLLDEREEHRGLRAEDGRRICWRSLKLGTEADDLGAGFNKLLFDEGRVGLSG